MAYLFRGNKVLSRDLHIPQTSEGYVIRFMSYDDPYAEPVTVALVSKLGVQPLTSFCPGQSYRLRVAPVDNCFDCSGIKILNYHPSSSEEKTFRLVSPAEVTRPVHLHLSTPQGKALQLDKYFIGQLRIEDQPTTNNYFALRSSPNWSSVGLSGAYPNQLSNCQQCGCKQGQTCSENGDCVNRNLPCSSSGECGGRCYGKCPKGQKCQRKGILYRCEAKSKLGGWFWFLISLILAIFLILLFFLFWKSSSSSKEKSSTETLVIKPPPKSSLPQTDSSETKIYGI